MIRTSRQLKDLVRNMAKGDSGKSQLLIRNYAMERFLERVARSKYKDNFILKGGMLVSAMVGLDNRATMDIDTTIRNLLLDVGHAKRIVEEIAAVEIDDNIRFFIRDVSNIMDETEYGGVRLSLDAFLDTTKIPLKIDISTGDVVTPAEITYHYKLMFEQRYISLWAYTLETVLAEKIETVLSRGVANTRPRDFYDIHILYSLRGAECNPETLLQALERTANKRGSQKVLRQYQDIISEIRSSEQLRGFWKKYQRDFDYAKDISFDDACDTIQHIMNSMLQNK